MPVAPHNNIQATTRVSGPPRRRRARSGKIPGWWVLGTVLVIAFAYVYIGGNYGWYNIWDLKQEKTELENAVTDLEAERLDLNEELDLMKRDPTVDVEMRRNIERKAREEYGMVREGEMVYRFKDEDLGKSDSGTLNK